MENTDHFYKLQKLLHDIVIHEVIHRLSFCNYNFTSVYFILQKTIENVLHSICINLKLRQVCCVIVPQFKLYPLSHLGDKQTADSTSLCL